MTMTLYALLAWGKQQLAQMASGALDAEVLLAAVLKIDRAQLYGRCEAIVALDAKIHFEQLIARRLSGEPVAYILGYREFWSLPLKVMSAVLIPRPETEQLVETLLNKLPADKICSMADLGTGSGAIALAVASERPHWRIIATDKMQAALTVARDNAQSLQISNIHFRHGSWFAALNADEYFDAIVSNPPYINEDDPLWRQDRNFFEPTVALLAQENGLAALRGIIEGARAHLKANGWLMLEHGYDQENAVKKLLIQNGYKNIENQRDLAGIPRIAVAQKI